MEQDYRKRHTVKPVLRGRLWDNEKLSLGNVTP